MCVGKYETGCPYFQPLQNPYALYEDYPLLRITSHLRPSSTNQFQSFHSMPGHLFPSLMREQQITSLDKYPVIQD
jgi:hypothetical protein